MPEIHIIPNWVQLIVQITSTLFLFFIIRYFAWDPMKEFIKKRQEIISEELTQAENIKAEALAFKETAESAIQGAKEEARKIVENSKHQAQSTYDQIIEDGREEVKQKLAKATVAINQERTLAYAQMKEDIVNITVNSTEKMIKKEIDQEAHQELFNDFMAKVGGSNE